MRFGIEQVEPFYEVFARTMRDLGTPVLGRAFFERIARVFADIVVFAAVYSGTRPVAAGCGSVFYFLDGEAHVAVLGTDGPHDFSGC